MPGVQRPWRADESVADLTLFGDWDSVASMILSLRIHWFEYGTIPTWNYMFCGGRPELSIPYSWAYTWPSVFAYALPPNHAIIALWVVMTLVGFLATRAVLLRWSGSSLGASVGAIVYVFSGYFAARFNAGHVTFAFFHLVPLLILLFEIGFARALAKQRDLGVSALAVVASCFFVSAALPHALIHFYPAFVLLVVIRVASGVSSHGTSRSLRAAITPVVANLLGFWLAAYKLWPVIRWQLDSPRAGVRLESYRLIDVIGNTLTFVPNYFQHGKQQVWHVFSSWEYNAFVGPLAWLLALAALIGMRGRGQRTAVSHWFAFLVIAAGVALALGNDNPFSPAYLFEGLPVLNGVRAFSRYQILIVFGLAVLVAHGVALVTERVTNPKLRVPLLVALVLGATAPVVVQSASLIWNISAESNAKILASYGGRSENPPQQVRTRGQRLIRSRHQTSLLAGGYWIANCNPNLTLPGAPPSQRRERVVAISVPPPSRVERIGRNDLTLRYPADLEGPVTLNLRHLDGSRLNLPSQLQGQKIRFDGAALPGGRLTLSTVYPGPGEGAVASAAGVVASLVFLGVLSWRERSW